MRGLQRDKKEWRGVWGGGGTTYVRVGEDELSEGGVEGVSVDALTGGEHEVRRGSVPC